MPVDYDLERLNFYESKAFDGAEEVKRIGAQVAYEVARRLCPVDRTHGGNHLYQTIEVIEEGDDFVVVAGDPSRPSGADPKRGITYAAPVEYGSDHDEAWGHKVPPYHIAAQPFMRPGYAAGKAAALAAGAHFLDLGGTPLSRQAG